MMVTLRKIDMNQLVMSHQNVIVARGDAYGLQETFLDGVMWIYVHTAALF